MSDSEAGPVPQHAVIVGVIPDQPPRVLKEAARYAQLLGAPLTWIVSPSGDFAG
ncbi:hypothetical protein [Microbacterium aurum]